MWVQSLFACFKSLPAVWCRAAEGCFFFYFFSLCNANVPADTTLNEIGMGLPCCLCRKKKPSCIVSYCKSCFVFFFFFPITRFQEAERPVPSISSSSRPVFIADHLELCLLLIAAYFLVRCRRFIHGCRTRTCLLPLRRLSPGLPYISEQTIPLQLPFTWFSLFTIQMSLFILHYTMQRKKKSSSNEILSNLVQFHPNAF